MGSPLPRRAARSCRCSSNLYRLSSPFLFLSLILPATSFAQLTTSSDVGVPTSDATPTASQKSSTIDATKLASIGTASTPHATTLSTLTSAASHLATGSTSHTADTDAPDNDTTTSRNTSLLNYYFVFLALFGVLLFVGVYFLHQRKKRLKARFQNSGQSALARDLDGWTSSRRWIHGNWRSGTGGNGNTQRREEGLNELGEAPPPYKPRADATGTVDDTQAFSEQAVASGSTLSVPLGALARDGRATLKPPDYDETVRTSSIAESDDHSISRPPAAARPNSRPISRPTTAALSTAESTAELVNRNHTDQP